MPYINVRLTDDGVTAKQKQDIIQRITQTMVDVLNKDPETTFVVIDEVKTENWGVAGQTVQQLRASREQAQAALSDLSTSAISEQPKETQAAQPLGEIL